MAVCFPMTKTETVNVVQAYVVTVQPASNALTWTLLLFRFSLCVSLKLPSSVKPAHTFFTRLPVRSLHYIASLSSPRSPLARPSRRVARSLPTQDR